MKIKSVFFVLTTLTILTCTAASAQPQTPQTLNVSIENEDPRRVSNIEELFELVLKMKQDSTLNIHQEWVQQEYDRLVRELDKSYHPSGEERTSRDTTQVSPSSYSWAARDGRP